MVGGLNRELDVHGGGIMASLSKAAMFLIYHPWLILILCVVVILIYSVIKDAQGKRDSSTEHNPSEDKPKGETFLSSLKKSSGVCVLLLAVLGITRGCEQSPTIAKDQSCIPPTAANLPLPSSSGGTQDQPKSTAMQFTEAQEEQIISNLGDEWNLHHSGDIGDKQRWINAELKRKSYSFRFTYKRSSPLTDRSENNSPAIKQSLIDNQGQIGEIIQSGNTTMTTGGGPVTQSQSGIQVAPGSHVATLSGKDIDICFGNDWACFVKNERNFAAEHDTDSFEKRVDYIDRLVELRVKFRPNEADQCRREVSDGVNLLRVNMQDESATAEKLLANIPICFRQQ
jgi:hypothetical protein